MMRFNQVIVFLMVIAAFSALVMPPGINAVRKVDKLFAPVSYPVRSLAGAFDARLARPQKTPSQQQTGTPTPQQLADENEALKYQVSFLTAENERLSRQLHDILRVGIPPEQLRVAAVIGGDPGNQQVLSIQIPPDVNAVSNMPVAYPYGLVGRLQVVGLGAARVRLITDKASLITGEFVRYHKGTGSFEHLPQLPKPVEGTGDGRMIIKSVKNDEITPAGHKELALAVGDWVIVKDKDLTAVQGLKLGEIESITESRQALFSNIILRPDQDLMKLREVMVMVRK